MNKNFLYIGGILVLIVGYFVFFAPAGDDTENKDDDNGVEQTDDTNGSNGIVSFAKIAHLSDVTGGFGTGNISIGFTDGTFNLEGDMTGINDPQDGFFYEGWLVGGSAGVLSTGVVEKGPDGTFVNEFTANKDYTDATQYILTIEPDDGDPAPADHVLEGPFEDLN